MTPVVDARLPSLAELLKNYVQAKVAREIDRPRSFVHRLAKRKPLYDSSVIPELARVLRVDESHLRRIVENDLRRVRIERRNKGRAA